ncbi:hypothetical protein Tco_0047260 [Tanacetum coccineum]
MVKALLLDKKNQSPAPTPVKAVEESCVTCGGAHSYQTCPATSGNVYRDNIQEYVSQAAAANFNQGNTGYRAQISNQIRPPGFPPVQNHHVQIKKQSQNRLQTKPMENFNQAPAYPIPGNQGQVYPTSGCQPPAISSRYQAPFPQTQKRKIFPLMSPPELELKTCQPHLDMQFEGDDKLPFKNAKDLKNMKRHSNRVHHGKGPVQLCPKKGGMTVVKNDENDLIPTRLTHGNKSLRDSFSTWSILLAKMLKRWTDTNLVPKLGRKAFPNGNKKALFHGHKITKSGIEVDRAKVDVIAQAPSPALLRERCPKYSLGTPNLMLSSEIKKEQRIWAADHLFRLENPHQDKLKNKEITETFPFETLGSDAPSAHSTPLWRRHASFPFPDCVCAVIVQMSPYLKPLVLIDPRSQELHNPQLHLGIPIS